VVKGDFPFDQALILKNIPSYLPYEHKLRQLVKWTIPQKKPFLFYLLIDIMCHTGCLIEFRRRNMKKKVEKEIESLQRDIDFSGTFYVKTADEEFTRSYGFANRSEKIVNQTNTRYGIASGSKILTAIAICQLVEQGKLSLETKVKDYLHIDFPHFDQQITIHHLLTHTSGIPDYFDEEEMDDYEELWATTPMYRIRKLQDFLPLFQDKKMKLSVGSKFHYNNAGYIILGLVVEQASGLPFSKYVEQFIFGEVGISDSGYFSMDALPERAALGYIEEPEENYRTNIYSLPAKGGSDGGAYVTVKDMATIWEALVNYQLLSEEMTKTLLHPHVQINKDIYYGYGVYMKKQEGKVEKFILMGYDPGVNFRFVYYPEENISIIVCSNKSDGAFDMIQKIEKIVCSRYVD
jgi:CubicO group peptidase (beta-lactamase class C family)